MLLFRETTQVSKGSGNMPLLDSMLRDKDQHLFCKLYVLESQ